MSDTPSPPADVNARHGRLVFDYVDRKAYATRVGCAVVFLPIVGSLCVLTWEGGPSAWIVALPICVLIAVVASLHVRFEADAAAGVVRRRLRLVGLPCGRSEWPLGDFEAVSWRSRFRTRGDVQWHDVLLLRRVGRPRSVRSESDLETALAFARRLAEHAGLPLREPPIEE